MGARQVRGGENTLGFEQLGITFRTGRKRKHGFLVFIQIEHSEHFASNSLISYPKHEVGSPLHGFHDVGQSQQIFAQTFGIHF